LFSLIARVIVPCFPIIIWQSAEENSAHPFLVMELKSIILLFRVDLFQNDVFVLILLFHIFEDQRVPSNCMKATCIGHKSTWLRSCIDSQYRGKPKMIYDFTQSSSPFVATVPYRVSPLKNGEEIFGYCNPERTETTCRNRGGASETCVFWKQLQFNGMKSSTTINGAINNNLEYAGTSAQAQISRDCVGYSDCFIPSRQSSNLSPTALDASDFQWSADDEQANPTNSISRWFFMIDSWTFPD